MSKGTFVDLFAGIGGFHYALKGLGLTCVLAVEKDPACRKIYAFNHKIDGDRLVNDIRSLTREDPADIKTELKPEKIRYNLKNKFSIKPGIDFLCGGFPCQPFSKSGKQEGSDDDIRGTLFKDIVLLVKALKPKYIILENVRNLAGPKHRETLGIIRKKLIRAGYTVDDKHIILSPHKLTPDQGGAPQARDRVFILAHKKKRRGSSHLRDLTSKVNEIGQGPPFKWSLSKILIEPNPKNYTVSAEEGKLLNFWDQFVKKFPPSKPLPGHPIWTDSFNQIPLPHYPQWKKRFIEKNRELFQGNRRVFTPKWMERVKKFPASRQKFEWQANQAHPQGRPRTIRDLAIQLRPSGVRVKPATYLPALVAITQTSIIGPDVEGNVVKKYRRISPLEAARLQGMNDIKFVYQAEDSTRKLVMQKDTLSYKQLGNAVNVGVVKFLAMLLMDEDAVAALSPEPQDNAKQRGKRGKPSKRRASGRA
jgi:DNA (cytosine-5)-methyltransferase 1